jgi:hypothetical protein
MSFISPVVFEIQANAVKALKEFDKVKKGLTELDSAGKKASKEMTDLEKRTNLLSGSMTKLAKYGVASLVTGFTALGTVSIKAAIQQEKSLALLQAAVTNTGQSYKAALPYINDASIALVKLGFHDDQTTAALAKLTAATGDVKIALRSLNTVADLARFKTMSLADAGEMLARASTGQARGLRDLGIAMGISIKKGATYADILAAVEERIGGTAEAFAKTAPGKMEIFSAQLDLLKEQIGYKLLPAFIKFVDWLNKEGLAGVQKFITFVEKNTGKIKIFAAVIAGVFAGVGIAKFIILIGEVTAAMALLRTTATGAAIATAIATGGVSVGLALTALAGVAALGITTKNLLDLTGNKELTNMGKNPIQSGSYLESGIGDGADYQRIPKGNDALLNATQKIKDAKTKATLAAAEIKAAWEKLVGKDVKKAIDEGMLEPTYQLVNKVNEAKAAYAEATTSIASSLSRLTIAQNQYLSAVKSGNKAAILSTESAMNAAQKALDDLQSSAAGALQNLASLQTDIINKIIDLQNDILDLEKDKTKAINDANDEITDLEKKYYIERNDLYAEYNLRVLEAEQQAAKDRAAIIKMSVDQLRGIFKSATDKSIGEMFDALTFQGRYVAGGTPSALMNALQSQLDKTKQLSEDASKLAGQGFSQTFIEQVIAQGPELGHQLAQTILTAAPESITELKRLWEELSVATNTGVDVIANKLNSGLTLATTELSNQLKQVDLDLATTLANLQQGLTNSLTKSLSEFTANVQSIRNVLSAAIAEINAMIATKQQSINTLTTTANAITTQAPSSTSYETTLKNLQKTATPGSAASWRIGEELSMIEYNKLQSASGYVKMADGGIVSKATSAIVGEAGPEAVIPLDRLDKMLSGVNSGGANITINANTNASATSIAQEVGWAIRTSNDVSYAINSSDRISR